MKIALAQFKPKISRNNLESHLDILAKQKNIDLIIFPELSLNGYYLQDKIFEDAWKISELSEISEYSNKFDILVGGAIKDNRDFFNSALYFSKGNLIHHHKKLHLPNYGMFEEARFFAKGDKIESFETHFGKFVTLICEDIWRGSTLAEIEKIQPDYLIIIANSPARGFKNGKIEIIEQWKSILKTASIFAKSKTVFINRVGFEDGLGFWGGSMTLNNKGEILDELPLYNEMTKIIDL